MGALQLRRNIRIKLSFGISVCVVSASILIVSILKMVEVHRFGVSISLSSGTEEKLQNPDFDFGISLIDDFTGIVWHIAPLPELNPANLGTGEKILFLILILVFCISWYLIGSALEDFRKLQSARRRRQEQELEYDSDL